jgi:hypothetical protein
MLKPVTSSIASTVVGTETVPSCTRRNKYINVCSGVIPLPAAPLVNTKV